MLACCNFWSCSFRSARSKASPFGPRHPAEIFHDPTEEGGRLLRGIRIDPVGHGNESQHFEKRGVSKQSEVAWCSSAGCFWDFTPFFRKCLRNQALSRFSFLKYPAFWTTWPWLSHFLLQQSMLPKLAKMVQSETAHTHLPTPKPKQHWHPTNWDMLPCFQPYQHHFCHKTPCLLRKWSTAVNRGEDWVPW